MIEYSKQLSNISNLTHGFFDNYLGNMSLKTGDKLSCVIKNRLNALKFLHLSSKYYTQALLDHTSKALFVDKSILNKPFLQISDALITDLDDVVLAITYADCLPIIIASEKASIIGIIHAGWRGVQQNIIKKTINLIKEYTKENLYVSIGPCISHDYFMVDKDVAEKFDNYKDDIFYDKDKNKYFINILNIAIQQIKAEGIYNIEKVGGYTDKELQKYFSYRIQKDKAFRHMALVSKYKL